MRLEQWSIGKAAQWLFIVGSLSLGLWTLWSQLGWKPHPPKTQVWLDRHEQWDRLPLEKTPEVVPGLQFQLNDADLFAAPIEMTSRTWHVHATTELDGSRRIATGETVRFLVVVCREPGQRFDRVFDKGGTAFRHLFVPDSLELEAPRSGKYLIRVYALLEDSDHFDKVVGEFPYRYVWVGEGELRFPKSK